MQTVHVSVERAKDGYYRCQTENDFMGRGLTGYGRCLDTAEANLRAAYEEAKNVAEESGKIFPEVSFVFDYKDNILTYGHTITLGKLMEFLQDSLSEHPNWRDKPVFTDAWSIAGRFNIGTDEEWLELI